MPNLLNFLPFTESVEQLFNTIDLVRLLGPGWALKRVRYEFERRHGRLKRKIPCRPWKHDAPRIAGQFFNHNEQQTVGEPFRKDESDQILRGKFIFFSKKSIQCGLPPNWFVNPIDNVSVDEKSFQSLHWSEIPDFVYGDIKSVWELSRFFWVYPLVRSYFEEEEKVYEEVFWQLTEDWFDHNPPNNGVHWKCGQEITIRMFALVTAYYAFYNAPLKRKILLSEIIHESAKRIESNIGYAVNQRNNHGICEAAGLFSAGIVFGKERWIRNGSSLLEDQIKELVFEDGSFGQHSANYHRVMLHACLWAIQLGRSNQFEFSAEFIERIRKAGIWLVALYDEKSGRMPNLGANDGALILPYSHCDYLDYRPTIQAVGAVVEKKRWISNGPWDDLALWLVPGLPMENETQPSEKKDLVSARKVEKSNSYARLAVFSEGGYAIFSNADSKLIFRCPKKFHFRPVQCDLLHVDLWIHGMNLLRDAGTYSYHCPQPWQKYFKSTAAHNTVQFDEHNQMPEVSRFLYAKWPRLDIRYANKNKSHYIEAGFIDWKGCSHYRTITPMSNGYKIIDKISGEYEKAVLRWRLLPELDWKLDRFYCSTNEFNISIRGHNISNISIEDGWESLYYMEKTAVPVLETTVGTRCREITTTICFG